jgi:hypothetical protein
MQVEIYGPDNKVHYRRPIHDRDVFEALERPGYYVLCPRCQERPLPGCAPGRLFAPPLGAIGLRCTQCGFASAGG